MTSHKDAGNVVEESDMENNKDYISFPDLITPTEKKNGTIYNNQSYFLYKCLK